MGYKMFITFRALRKIHFRRTLSSWDNTTQTCLYAQVSQSDAITVGFILNERRT